MLNEPKSAKNHGNNDIHDAFFAYMGSAARTSPTAALSFSISGTRYKESGAVAGPHKVGFEWADIEFDAMSGLKAELVEGGADATRKAFLKKSIQEIKQKLASGPKLRPNLIKTFDVPSEGTSSADFELAETSD